MKVSLDIIGERIDLSQIIDLKRWIEESNIQEIKITSKDDSNVSGSMGLDPLTSLEIILGSTAIVQLVKSIHVWIRAKRQKFNVKLTMNGKSIIINSENYPEPQKLIQDVYHLLKEDD